MKITVRDLEMEFQGNPAEAWKLVEQVLEEKGLFLNSVEIDGEEWEEDMEQGLAEKLPFCRELHVIAYTAQELSVYFWQQAKDLITSIVEKTEILIPKFYIREEDSEDLDALSEVMSKAYQLIPFLENLISLGSLSVTYAETYPKVLSMLKEAIQKQDFHYLADLLHFELEEQLNTMRSERK